MDQQNVHFTRREAVKLTGGVALASGLPLAASPATGSADNPSTYRDWIPASGVGEDDCVEFAYLDLETLRANAEERDETLNPYLDPASDADASVLPSILRLPINVTLSLTVSSLGVLLFANVITLGWDSDETRPDLSSSTLLWVNGVAIVKGSFEAADAIEAIRSRRDNYEQAETYRGFELYEREESSIDLLGRDGRAFAAAEDTLLVSLREDGIDRIKTVLDTWDGDEDPLHEQSASFDWATRETEDCSVVTGAIGTDAIDDVSLEAHVGDLEQAPVVVDGIEANGYDLTGRFCAAFGDDVPSQADAEEQLETESATIDRDNTRLRVLDNSG